MSTIATTAATAARIEALLATPSTVAHMLNWQMNLARAVLSIHIGESSMELAVMSHPGTNRDPIQSLPSIPLQQQQQRRRSSGGGTLMSFFAGRATPPSSKLLAEPDLQTLSNIVRDHNVCGVVVGWPTKEEAEEKQERLASGGRVLQALDQIVQETDLVTPARPLCLWDGNHCLNVSIGSSANNNGQQEGDGVVAAAVAADYLRSHWPDLTSKVLGNYKAEAELAPDQPQQQVHDDDEDDEEYAAAFGLVMA